MYIPPAFQNTDRASLLEFIERNSFGLLISQSAGELIASHLPLLVGNEENETILFGHMARANGQWRRIEGDALAIFSGPHAYISPSWYERDDLVPTRNYVAVHAYGTLDIIDDANQAQRNLEATVQFFERRMPQPWTLDLTNASLAKLLPAIVSFRIRVRRLEGKWKLGQNHPPERRARVAEELARQSDPDSQAIANLMRALL
jgi:transcriptional regulator